MYQPSDAEFAGLIDVVNPDGSPVYNPNSPYVPDGSPAYNPNSPYVGESPPYAPYSPAYNPNSPYAGESPPYAPGSPAYNPNSPYVGESPPYAPYSPAYAPGSPDYPPPGSPDYPPPGSTDYMDIGGQSQRDNANMVGGKPSFYTGGEVLFRGDSMSDRLWKIKNIGDKFITIETDNTTGLSLTDCIKVVTQSDIYTPNTMNHRRNVMQPLYNPNEQMIQPKIPDSSNVPSINIKIVNGDDKTEQSGYQETENNDMPRIKMNPALATESVDEIDNVVSNDVFNSGKMIIKKV